jgi:hypothetical protein
MQAKPSDKFECSLQKIAIATIQIEEEDIFAIIYQGLAGHLRKELALSITMPVCLQMCL